MHTSNNITTPGTPYYTPSRFPESSYQTPPHGNTDRSAYFTAHLTNWKTPGVQQQQIDKDELLKQLDFIYEVLEEFIPLPIDEAIDLASEHRTVLKLMIDFFVPHMEEFEDRSYVYQQTYAQVQEKLLLPELKDYFS